MKKRLLIAALISMIVGGATAQEKFSFKFYGFVRNYACYDTRESLTSNSEQFYYMPKDVKLDADGNDINAQPNMMLLSITTRLGLNITGPEFLGAKTSAKIESDFAGFGTSNTVLRIRQAYAKMDWEHNKLLVGQAWHPMMGDMMPDVFSLETGAPFTPFSRTPQLRYDYVNKGVTLTATALYQFQYTSYGPDGASFNYARNAVVPELYFQAMYKNGGFQAGVQAAGLGFFEKGQRKLRLIQRFAAGKGEAAGLPIKAAILLHLGQHGFDGHGLAGHFQRGGGAAFSAGGAVAAGGAIQQVAAFLRPVAASGAGSQALAAAHAFFRRVKDLRLAGEGFRVVAPQAAQMASLQKHRGADAGAIVDGVALDVENRAQGVRSGAHCGQ